MNRNGSTGIVFTLAVGTMMAMGVAASWVSAKSRNRQLVRQLNAVEGAPASEVGAWAMFSTTSLVSLPSSPSPTPSPTPIARTTVFHVTDEAMLKGMQRYKQGNMTGTSTSDKYCGNMKFDPMPETQRICLKKAVDPCDETNPRGLINFEKFPDGSIPTDNMAITDQYWASHGVKFSLPNGNLAHIGKFGGPTTGFLCSACGNKGDTLIPGENYGQFFLTDDGVWPGPASGGLVVTYAKPVSKLSFDLIDIDDGEWWKIEARNALGITIDTVTFTASGDTYSGRGKYVYFDHGTKNDIYSLKLSGGGPDGQPGVAFDHFAASEVCSSSDLCNPNNPKGIITFETLPAGLVPISGISVGEGFLVSNQYWDSHGVSFCIDKTGDKDCDDPGEQNAAIYKTGAPGNKLRDARAWYCSMCTGNSLDMALPDQGVGNYFLSNNTVGDSHLNHPEGVIIKYKSPVKQLSGQIIDLDDDTATIEARDAFGNILERKTLVPLGEAGGDGKVSTFFFDHPTNDIYSIYMRVTGSALGFAFDNFSATSICPSGPKF